MTDDEFVNVEPLFRALCPKHTSAADRIVLFARQAQQDIARGVRVVQKDDGSFRWPREQAYRVLCTLSGAMAGSVRDACERTKLPCPQKPIEGALAVALALDRRLLLDMQLAPHDVSTLGSQVFLWYQRTCKQPLTSRELCISAAGLLRTERYCDHSYGGDASLKRQQHGTTFLEFALLVYKAPSDDCRNGDWQRASVGDFFRELANWLLAGRFPIIGWRARSLLGDAVHLWGDEHRDAIQLCLERATKRRLLVAADAVADATAAAAADSTAVVAAATTADAADFATRQ